MTAAALNAGRTPRETDAFDSIADTLDAIAGWMADELAGGRPPKWVAQQAAAEVWCLADTLRGAA